MSCNYEKELDFIEYISWQREFKILFANLLNKQEKLYERVLDIVSRKKVTKTDYGKSCEYINRIIINIEEVLGIVKLMKSLKTDISFSEIWENHLLATCFERNEEKKKKNIGTIF